MPTPCGRCKHSSSLCKVDLRSGRCSECIRCERRCDLSITRQEWLCLKKEKANLEKDVEERKEAVTAIMVEKLQLRKKLAMSTGVQAKAVNRKLASLAEREDKLNVPTEPGISFPPSPNHVVDGPEMSPQSWASEECLPRCFWSTPGPQTLPDDGTVFGEFDIV